MSTPPARWSTTNRPPCSYPPDCPYAGGPGTCYASEGRTPRELHQLWSYCFGRPVADALLAEWIRDTERAVADCEDAARTPILRYATDWTDMAGRYRQQLAALRAVRTPAAEVIHA